MMKSTQREGNELVLKQGIRLIYVSVPVKTRHKLGSFKNYPSLDKDVDDHRISESRPSFKMGLRIKAEIRVERPHLGSLEDVEGSSS